MRATVGGSNGMGLRAQNRGSIVRLLQQHGALSRRDLARRSGLDASTITYIATDFLRAGLVRECGEAVAPRQPRRGRREVAIELLPEGGFAVGVHLGVEAVRVA